MWSLNRLRLSVAQVQPPDRDLNAPDTNSGTGTGSQVPTCYRHPGRETYVSCVRCGRHACPDCMRSAAVGQQCVECIGQGARRTRQASTAFGARPAAGAAVTSPLVPITDVVCLA